jgi:6-phosphogluconate dehydrogenase (decarboxylating)
MPAQKKAWKPRSSNGVDGAFSLEEAVGKLTSSKKIVWVMVPAGQATTETIDKDSGAC